jgi:hypothetical protein
MVSTALKSTASILSALLVASALVPAQQSPPNPLNTSGSVVIDGHSTPYLIRHLPASSFPDLPPAVTDQLDHLGCLIPQSYEARQPENVVHASLENRGSSDWAVLCSARGTVSLLVFFGSDSGQPITLASSPETERLQSHGTSGVLGFNWAIDPASPQQVREAQAGRDPRPPLLDHDALADTLVDRHTVYHFYLKSAWIVLEVQD